MLQLHSFSVTNALFWKDAIFTPVEGVSAIYGRNRSGKSLLFRLMSQAIWGSQSGKRGAESSKLPKGSAVNVKVGIGKHSWEIKATPSSVSLLKNGNSLELAGKTQALDRLRELIPIHKELYDETVHLSGNVPSILIRSNPAQRLDWFLSIFRFDDVYDSLLEKILPSLSEAKKSKIELDVLNGEIKSTCGEKTLEDMSRDLTNKMKDLESLEKVQASYQARISQLNSAYSLIKEMERFPKGSSTRKIKKKLPKYRKRLEAALEYEEACRAYMERAEAYREYVQKKEKIDCLKSEAASRVVPLKDVNSLIREGQNVAHEADRLLSVWKDEEGIRVKLSAMKRPELSKEDTAEALSLSKSDLAKYRKQIQDMETSGKFCLTCGRRVTKRHLKKHRKKTIEALKYTEARLAKYRQYSEYYTLESQVTLSEPPPAEVSEVVRSVLKHAEDQVELQSRLSRVLAVEEELKVVSKPIKPSKPVNYKKSSVLKGVVKEMEESIVMGSASRFLGIKKQLSSLLKELSVPKQRVPSEIEKVRRELEGLSGRVASLHGDVANIKSAIERAKSLNSKVIDIKPVARMEPILAELKEAFGKKGLRVKKAEDLAALFQGEVNSLAHLVWGASTSVDVFVKNSGLHIILHRNGVSSDLSVLSGSEERLWKAISGLAIIKMLPSHLRTDFIILDELESMLDATSREIFARDFLPELQKYVPKIIVISPLGKTALPIACTSSYTVRMKGRHSILEATD